MRHVSSRFGKAAVLATVFVILAGCNLDTHADGREESQSQKIRSAWLVYWDLDAGEKELKTIRRVDKLSFFGGYFDKFDRLFVPGELNTKHKELKRQKKHLESYLTFINDRQNWDGTLVTKDIEVLRRRFADEAAIDRHIDEIIDLTLQGGYDGVEIDYEKIWKDKLISQAFGRFTAGLYTKAAKNKLKLRIVLEPSTPFASGNFPQGPEYVVMNYNLFGLHGDPGPKANREFIEKMIDRMKALPAGKAVAFATGGCLWGDNGQKRFLTEVEAAALAVAYGCETRRDKESQCLVFEYSDMGTTYQVWYADHETLDYWISIARRQGIDNISLWRLGGNVDIRKIQ